MALIGLLGFVGGMVSAQSSGRAEVPRGLWQSNAGPGGVHYHVRTRRCGRALCGRVERVKNARGYDTPSNAVSLMVLQEMRPQPDGSYVGTVIGVDGLRYGQSRVTLSGGALQVQLCDQAECRDEVWGRVR